MKDLLIDVKGLSVTIRSHLGPLTLVDGTDISLKKGEILGLVGESGSGKSITVSTLMGLYNPNKTRVQASCFRILGQDASYFTERDWQSLRGRHIAMIFQDPMTALNPIVRVGQQIREALPPGQQGDDKVLELLKKVGLTDPERRLKQYPHELSGGMRQRVVIAMALAGKPEIIIADEPTTALDVTIEAQILNRLKQLVKEEGLSLIFISHNLRVVSQLCDRVMVMYGGQWVEEGLVDSIFYSPAHPYTKALLAALPQGKHKGELKAIVGQPPDLAHKPNACAFHPRCAQAMMACAQEKPPILVVARNGEDQAHRIRCWLPLAERTV